MGTLMVISELLGIVNPSQMLPLTLGWRVMSRRDRTSSRLSRSATVYVAAWASDEVTTTTSATVIVKIFLFMGNLFSFH